MSHILKREAVAALAGVEIFPMGNIAPELLERISHGTREVLGANVSVHQPHPVPQSAYQPGRGQYNASIILNAIREGGRNKGWKAVGLLGVDIYSPGLNFVFGQADASGTVAVVSLARLRNEFYALPPDEDILVERAVKEVVHEVGHLLGLAHCKDPNCVMFFSNSLTDTDRKGNHYCQSCREKLA